MRVLLPLLRIPAERGPRIKSLIVLVQSDVAGLQAASAQIHVAAATNMVLLAVHCVGSGVHLFLCLSGAGKKRCERDF